MELRTARGKILLVLAGTVGAALVVFVVAPWLQAPAPPVLPVSSALGPVAQPVEEGGEDQEVVGELPAPLTPDEVASAIERWPVRCWNPLHLMKNGETKRLAGRLSRRR